MAIEGKLTKKDHFITLQRLVADAKDAGFEGFNFSLLEDFLDNELQLLGKRAEAAHQRAEKKNQILDKMTAEIANLVTEKPQTIIDLLPQLQDSMGDSQITTQKMIPRLNKLVKLGIVDKTKIVMPDFEGNERELTGYFLPETNKEETEA